MVLPAVPALALNSAEVVITAEGECLAITNTEASFAVGIIAEGGTKKWGDSDTQSLVTNAGNVTVKVVVTGTDLVGTASTWVLADTAASMIYAISANDIGAGTLYTHAILKSGGPTLVASLGSAATGQWSMEFYAPTALTELDAADPLTGTVTLTASTP